MANSQADEQFEDRFRRMLLANEAQSTTHPIVRLPSARHQHAQHYHQTQQQTPQARGGQHGQQRQAPAQFDRRQAPTPNAQFVRQDWRQPSTQANAFNRNQYASRPQNMHYAQQQQQHLLKSQYLQDIFNHEIPAVEMTQEERQLKEAFRLRLQAICQEVCTAAPLRLPSVTLHCFGSFSSGFASAGSDMDLVIVSERADVPNVQFSLMEDDLPRELELRLLQLNIGARLLTRTRVPIIKICEEPTAELLFQLREERQKWDSMSFDDKYPHLKQETGEQAEPEPETVEEEEAIDTIETIETEPADAELQTKIIEAAPTKTGPVRKSNKWTRERKTGPLDFPKDGVGIQSDINFFNPLGLHNTQLLRCYSLCDPRVRPIVLFVKAWAKMRKINSAYSGTLSSYGYVLMVLHYLINIARPPVLPNLQAPWRPHAGYAPQGADSAQVDEWVVDFWRREHEISDAAAQGQLTQNRESVGELLAGFFQYYASSHGRTFHWMQSVLSLRTPGGILTKEIKGWTKARTEEGEGHKVQYRYLFCIEDPFELSHNVARTVTHFGIVAIRDEFRRANRILSDIAHMQSPIDGHLFDPVDEATMEHDEKIPKHKPKLKPATRAPPTSIDTADADAFPTLSAAPKVKAKEDPKLKPDSQPSAAEADTAEQSDPAGKKRSRRKPQRKIKLEL